MGCRLFCAPHAASARTHNLNFFNMRLILFLAGPLWAEQGHKAKNKSTPVQDLEYSVALAGGGGELYLRGIWRQLCNASELARLGVKISTGLPPQNFEQEIDADIGLKLPGIDHSSIPGRIMGLLCCIIEFRFWNYAIRQWMFPGAFAGMLSSDPGIANQAYAAAQEVWLASTSAESYANVNAGLMALRNKVYWLTQPAGNLVGSLESG